MAVRLARALATALAAVFLVALPAPLQAQRLAYRFSDRNTGAAFQYGIVDLATGAAQLATADEAQVDAVFTSDGQYAVSASARVVTVRHIPTGVQWTVAADFIPYLAHPRRPVLFGYTTAFHGPVRLDARGLVQWTPCAGPTTPRFDLSLDGAELFVACDTAEIVVLDADTGAERRRVPTLPGTRFVQVNAAGDLVVLGSDVGSSEIARLDPVTGQVLARRPSLESVARTGSRRQLLEARPNATPGVSGVYRLFDTATLAVSQVLPASLATTVNAFVSADGRDVVFVSSGYGVLTPSRVVRLNGVTGQVVAELVLPQNQLVKANVVPVPLPPVSPAVAVAGTDVTLSWRLPAESPQATGYWLDLGTAPGASNLGSYYLGAGETFHAAGAPLGRFFMRLRAVNQAGSSLPSVEFVLNLPPLD